MPVYVSFNNKTGTLNGTPHKQIVTFVVDVVVRVMESVLAYAVQLFVMVIWSTYVLLPILVFIVLMSLLNANLDTVILIMVMAYNCFVVETNSI